MCRATLLSQKIRAAWQCEIWKSRNKLKSQVNSQYAVAMERYSALTDERETVCCFLNFQEIRESPKKTQKLVTKRRVSRQPAQSESQKALHKLTQVMYWICQIKPSNCEVQQSTNQVMIWSRLSLLVLTCLHHSCRDCPERNEFIKLHFCLLTSLTD